MGRSTFTPIALVALVLGSCQSLSAQGGHTLEEMSFLSGCWAGQMGALDMREQWTDVEGGVMLGTTRFFREGSLADFEFAMMVEEGDEVVLWPYPRGERSADGFPLVRTDGEYVFENLEHDFPVRIVYVRDGDDALSPRIEGSDGSGPGWSLRRVSCPSGG
jgi:hypothetical protein